MKPEITCLYLSGTGKRYVLQRFQLLLHGNPDARHHNNPWSLIPFSKYTRQDFPEPEQWKGHHLSELRKEQRKQVKAQEKMINSEDFLSALNDIVLSVQSATIPADQTNPFDLVDSIDGFYEE